MVTSRGPELRILPAACAWVVPCIWEGRTLNSSTLPIAETTPASRTSVAADASTGRAERRGGWPGLLRLISGIHVLALADQAVVSATRFLTTVPAGRHPDPSSVGG